ncbi:MAG: precorrin-3B C(17)-methyltransferase [Candidatus Hydrothermarchaeota archaeon]|nr:precorrin-3B C(17)-methyltransferase [Candidatus Hydrothermarchaeota archaeon]
MPGRIFLVGIGPGSKEHVSFRAVEAIKRADVIVSYETYLSFIEDFTAGKEIVARGMGQEVERARLAIEKALDGKSVAIVSSGDPGTYAMASVVFEYLAEHKLKLDVDVIPGITSANAAAAILGSPLGHDFAAISLSDLLTPWEVIERRLRHAAKADFVVVLYNPRSKNRGWQIERVREILLEYKSPQAPVGIVRNAMREGEKFKITTLEEMLDFNIDMSTMIIIGNSETFVYNGRMITPRGYKSKYKVLE